MAYKVVSFVGEEIKDRDDLNSIFTLPKSLKELSDGIKEQFLPGISSLYGKKDWYADWYQRYKEEQEANNHKIIANIIYENINDLYRTSLIWFIDNFFGSYYDINSGLFNFPYKLDNLHCYYIPDSAGYQNQDPTMIYIMLDQLADRAMLEITNKYNMVIYEKFITLMNNGKVKEFYEDLYKTVYNQDPTNYNADYIYTFCMSILRENAENEIIKIRKAMTLVMGNAATAYTSTGSKQNILDVIETNEGDNKNE
jgi:hypothetical protein